MFLYRAHLANNEIAKKILLKMKMGELTHKIHSIQDTNEIGRLVYLISLINKRSAFRIDPSGRLLGEFKQKIDAKTVQLPDEKVIFRKELIVKQKKAAFLNRVLDLLRSMPEGYSWKEITYKIGLNKYFTLSLLKSFLKKVVYREKKMVETTFTKPTQWPTVQN